MNIDRFPNERLLAVDGDAAGMLVRRIRSELELAEGRVS
jgi:hypothetical protein